MWSEIKNLVFKKKQTVILSVIFNQIEYKENREIADNIIFFLLIAFDQ